MRKEYKRLKIVPIENQNRYSSSEFFELIDMIAHCNYLAQKADKEWKRKLWYDHISNLLYRLEYIRKESLFRFVPNEFIFIRIKKLTQFYFELIF